MTDKNQLEKAVANRQSQLLIDALQSAARHGGTWVNETGKLAPHIVGKTARISAFNALMMALHSDRNHCDTNQYTLFNEAKKRGEAVVGGSKGVPFNWYNWSEYVNKHNADDKITREKYLSLSPEEQNLYKGVRQREVRTLFNIGQTTLKFVNEKGYEKELQIHGTRDLRGNLATEDKQLQRAVKQLITQCQENLMPIRRDGSGVAHYDATKDAVYMPNQKSFANYHDYVREVLRQIATATGYQQRLARKGVDNGHHSAIDDDANKQERLIAELTAGVKAVELGIPAKISKDNMGLVDYWCRELKENPCLIDAIETDVNNAVDMIHKVEKGEKIAYNTVQMQEQANDLRSQLPLHYYIADEIKDLPDKDMKYFVIVRDKAAGKADVILPSGASLEVNNEVPGMSKERIKTALAKENIQQVAFYNPNGALGYRPDDRYFEGKDVTVSKLSNWRLDDVTKLDVTDAVKRAGNVDFEKIMMLKDDDGKWSLFLKPENEPSFCIHPDKVDTNRFFTTLKQGVEENTDQVRQDLANKYYLLATQHPDLKKSLMGNTPENVDFSQIEKVSVFKTKAKDGEESKILCLPTISGVEKVQPREVTGQQWQRMWLADDMKEYKVQLAAALFADVLQKGQTQQETTNEKQEKDMEQKQTETTVQQNAEEKVVKPKEEQSSEKKEEEKRLTEEAKQKEQEQKQQTEKEKQEAKRLAALEHLLKQFYNLKEKHPDAVLLFRHGDFYNMFQQDTAVASKVLGLTVHHEENVKDKGKGLDWSTFPYHGLDTYLPKLIRAGNRVAICDQLEAPKRSQDREPEAKAEQKTGETEERQSHMRR